MATVLYKARPCFLLKKLKTAATTEIVPRRMAVTSETGSFLEEPKKTRFGLIGVAATVVTGLWIGSSLSKAFASFLEENDLFVPDDEDED